jgi:hypothetical protein
MVAARRQLSPVGPTHARALPLPADYVRNETRENRLANQTAADDLSIFPRGIERQERRRESGATETVRLRAHHANAPKLLRARNELGCPPNDVASALQDAFPWWDRNGGWAEQMTRAGLSRADPKNDLAWLTNWGPRRRPVRRNRRKWPLAADVLSWRTDLDLAPVHS